MKLVVLTLALLGALAARPALAREHLRLATTTSTVDSGLLDALLPVFERARGVELEVIAVGSGKAMALGRNGDADVLLVHSEQAERAFVAEGFGTRRLPVMYNDFIVVGPPDDPAGVRRAVDGVEALRRIAAARATFISRADASGTHVKEQELWRASGLFAGGAPGPGTPWYLEAGQGMGEVLRIAFEKRAYALADRGTYLALRRKIPTTLLFSGGQALRNPYSVIPVNPARHPHVRAALAGDFAAWLCSPATQQRILDFRVDGESLFHPLAVPQSALGAAIPPTGPSRPALPATPGPPPPQPPRPSPPAGRP